MRIMFALPVLLLACSQARPFDTGTTGFASQDTGDDWLADDHPHAVGDADDTGPVVINELLAASSDGGPDWLELYNSSDTQIDLVGWTIADNADEPWAFPVETRLAAGDFLLLYADDALGDEPDGLHLPFKLSKDGETVVLEMPDGTPASSVTFPALGADEAFARMDDGAADWVIAMDGGTPAASNAR